MPNQEFPVTRLYDDPDANGADFGVMIAPYDFMGHLVSLKNRYYQHRPSQTVFAQAMRRFGELELSPDVAEFVSETYGACSFHVVSSSSPASALVVHIGELVSVGDLLDHHFRTSPRCGLGNSRAGQEMRRIAESRSRMILAAVAYHKNPATGEAPHLETLYGQPAVLRPDGHVVLPKPTDLVATRDGDVVIQVRSCRVDDAMKALSFQLRVRDSHGTVQTCTRCADVPYAYRAVLPCASR